MPLCWENEATATASIEINHIDHFDARGMRPVYGRSDQFVGKATFHMSLWLDRRGQLLARFWSRSREVHDRSVAIIGLAPEDVPKRDKNEPLSDAWIPESLRQEYDDWISQEWEPWDED
ncbi:MAG: hypothetical protein GXY83_15260 [Rhodopirellula sp.]|nr:hypothetical protein [Rhodopirellula sp.]